MCVCVGGGYGCIYIQQNFFHLPACSHFVRNKAKQQVNTDKVVQSVSEIEVSISCSLHLFRGVL